MVLDEPKGIYNIKLPDAIYEKQDSVGHKAYQTGHRRTRVYCLLWT